MMPLKLTNNKYKKYKIINKKHLKHKKIIIKLILAYKTPVIVQVAEENI